MTRRCPFCAEEIQEKAIKCKHCGEWLGAEDEPTSARQPPQPKTTSEDFLFDWKSKPPSLPDVKVLFLGEDCFLGQSSDGSFGVWLRDADRPMQHFPESDAGWSAAWEAFTDLTDRYAEPSALDRVLLPSPRYDAGPSTVPLIVGGVVLVLIVAGLVGVKLSRGGTPGSTTDSSGRSIAGTLTLRQDKGPFSTNNFKSFAGSCFGADGFSDLAPGVSVTVSNEVGDILATVPLGSGRVSNGSCVFDFSITDLPAAQSYSIAVSHRGSITYTAKDLASNGWTVALTIGGR